MRRAHEARQRSDVRFAIGTALFAGNQDRREILGHRIAGYPVQHLSRIRRYTLATSTALASQMLLIAV